MAHVLPTASLGIPLPEDWDLITADIMLVLSAEEIREQPPRPGTTVLDSGGEEGTPRHFPVPISLLQ